MNTLIIKAHLIKAVKAKDAANVYRFRDLLNVARVKDDVVYEWIRKATEQKINWFNKGNVYIGREKLELFSAIIIMTICVLIYGPY